MASQKWRPPWRSLLRAGIFAGRPPSTESSAGRIMLVKAKHFTNPDDAQLKAGEDAERQMAHLLERRFGTREEVFIINDLRIAVQHLPPFQIDHLVVSCYGLFVVESKSIHATVTITRWDDQREHWKRSYRGNEQGMDSPVLQAAEQARLLRLFILKNTERLLGKLIGIQKGFGLCPFIPYVAISSTGIIDMVPAGYAPPKNVFKADEIAPTIDDELKSLAKKASLLNLSLESGWSMSQEEAKRTAEFLAQSHTPLRANKLTDPVIQPLQAGASCPSCQVGKLVHATAKQPDGSKAAYLACERNKDKSCLWHIRLEAPVIIRPNPISTTTPPQPSLPPPKIKTANKSLYCNACKAPISRNVAKYCFDRESQFGGKPYCMECQKQFPVKA
ncbi:MAG: nuclease-related domain-containing protein [Sulfurisoma sp.]|nr:nuclease-related domain-containing protein [Sulfurisoma sp.]